MADELKASIGLGNLKHALKITAMANSKASLMPTLQGVRLEQIADGLAVEATDLDVYIRVVLSELGGPQKPMITPADKFTAWTRLLTGEDVSITATNMHATLKCGRAKAILPLTPAKDWPSNDIYNLKAEGVTLTQGAFARALRFAQIAISDDASRITLNGVQICGDGNQLQVVATEGHCLLLYTLPCTERIDLLLPGRMVKAMLPLLDDEDSGVDVVFNGNQILATIDADTKIYVGGPRLTGQFPAWKNVYPRDKRIEVKVSSAELMASLERCFLLSDENSGAIDMRFNGDELTLHGANANHGTADEAVTYTGAQINDFLTRINGDFLRALLRKLDGDLTIAVPEKKDGALLFKAEPHEGETLGYIIMPMRLT